MKGNELWLRCQKARIVSWLQSTQIGAVISTMDGRSVVLAVYDNGRYVEPEPLHMPNSPADLGWGPDAGPDGPAHYGDHDQDDHG